MKNSRDKEYWYFTHHGVQPGSIPRNTPVLDVVDEACGSYFSTNRVLTTKELNEYEIKEAVPHKICSVWQDNDDIER